jgi:hypothetical protein
MREFTWGRVRGTDGDTEQVFAARCARPHTWLVTDSAGNHRSAAQRHEIAADTHDRSATFWDGRGDQPRARLQRDMAEYERQGAVLERRWADLMDADGGGGTTRVAELLVGETRRRARQLWLALTRTAEALDASAALADEHGQRRGEDGHETDAAAERSAAERAREAAGRARSQAEEWLRISQGDRALSATRARPRSG